tara:strand:- start:709 stop:879 length:171 start_codon:yes stop_codon:yes gene_type:complete
MVETVALTIGMIFVGIIIICLASTILSYIFKDQEDPNEKLLDNINKLDKKYKTKIR